MSNIYEQKAKKYKYKYLKLKQEYIGKGGNDYQEFEFIGSGAYGCIISPPFQFNNKNNIKISYQLNENIDNKIFSSKDYVGKLLSCDNNIFIDETDEFKKLNKIDPYGNHRSKLIFAAYMTKEELTKQLELIIYKTSNKAAITLKNCLEQKRLLKHEHEFNVSQNNYGYIITTKVGKSFDKINLNQYTDKDIIKILENLKKSIEDLITTLYTKNMIHSDIKFQNITLDDNFKVSFIDFGIMREYKEKEDREKLLNLSNYYLYPDILQTFSYIEKNYKVMMKKSTLIELFIKHGNLKQQFNEPTYNPTLLNITKLRKINYSHFFKSLEDNVPYSLDEIYNKCIEPIVKNIDIYALSLFIYELFYNYNNKEAKHKHDFKNIFNSQYRKNNAVGQIIRMLLINALYNNIDGPEELIIYLDGIINSLNGTYKKGDVKKKINERRTKLEIPYINYYKSGYSEEWIDGDENIKPFAQSMQRSRQESNQGQRQGQRQGQKPGQNPGQRPGQNPGQDFICDEEKYKQEYEQLISEIEAKKTINNDDDEIRETNNRKNLINKLKKLTKNHKQNCKKIYNQTFNQNLLEQIKKQSDIRIDNNNVSGCSEEEIANKYTEILNNTSISNKQQDQQIFDHATYCMDENNKINMKTTNQDIEKQYFEQYKKEDDKNRKKLIKQQQQ